MNHPYEEFAENSRLFRTFILWPSVIIGCGAGLLLGPGVGFWQEDVWLGLGAGFVSAIIAGIIAHRSSLW